MQSQEDLWSESHDTLRPRIAWYRNSSGFGLEKEGYFFVINNMLWRCPTASQRSPEMADRAADGMLSLLAAFTHPSLENLNATTPPMGSDSVEVQMAQKGEFKLGSFGWATKERSGWAT